MARTATAGMAATKARRTIDDRSAAPHKPLAAAPTPRRERNCSVARTLDIVSDAWAFLIIREAFFGTRTFEALPLRARHPAGDLDGPVEKADAARDLPPGRDRHSQPQGIPPHQDGVRSLSELHCADAVWRPLAVRKKARRR